MYNNSTSSQSFSGQNMLPYSINPAVMGGFGYKTEINPVTSITTRPQEALHPLQGIPFKLAPALEVSNNLQEDPVLTDVKKTLERVKHLLDSDEFNYDFNNEKRYLMEHCNK